MYEIVEEKMIRNITNSVGQRTALSLVHIVCDTAADMPEPLPHWISGSRCDVLENGGSVYLLSSQRTWTNVNFYNQGGEGGRFDPDAYYTKPQTDAKITEKVAEIVADAPEDFNTLKEMSDWIDSHEDSAAAMNSAIAKKPGEIVTGKQYTIDGKTVVAGAEAEVFNNITYNKASGEYSHAEGSGTTASGSLSHAEGGGTKASGRYSHAEGGGTTASGRYSHAEGGGTTASGEYDHAEGSGTKASGNYSHAEGSGTTASGRYSHAEGSGTTASGSLSHAEGGSTTASGEYGHAEGGGTKASGRYSHAEGSGTTASSNNQHVQGRYNVEDSNGKYAFIIGNGTSSAQHNAFAIDWSGLIYVNGASTGVDVNSMWQAVEGKVDKVPGKGLSTNDYTTEEKTKLADLENYDDTAITSRVSALETTVGDINSVLEEVL